MSDTTAQHAGLAMRVSDAEREQAVALLQHGFADGRLTQAELEERAAAAYAARTTGELSELTADLPAAEQQPPRPGRVLDRRLLCILLCIHPPAALVYWLYWRLSNRRSCRRLGTRLNSHPSGRVAGFEPGVSDSASQPVEARLEEPQVPRLVGHDQALG